MSIKPIGINTGTVAEVEANSRAMSRVLLPEVGGNYSRKLTSGVMAAGLAANSNVYHFRNSSPDIICLVRGVAVSAGNAGTAFAAGVATFRLFPARLGAGAPTTGNNATLSNPVHKLRSTMPATRIGDSRATQIAATFGVITIAATGALASAAATLDADPIAAVTQSVAGVGGELIIKSKIQLLDAPSDRYPLICEEWEGFTLQASVPATGTWSFSVTVEWEEVPAYL